MDTLSSRSHVLLEDYDSYGIYEDDKFEGEYQLCKFGIYERFCLKVGTELDWINKQGLSPIWLKTDADNDKQILIFFNISYKRWEIREIMKPETLMTKDHFYCATGLLNFFISSL